MRLIFTLALLLYCCATVQSQNCNLTIDLTPQIEFCGPGSTILLPVITGDFSSFSWSPTTGLSDPDQLITTASFTDSTVYTLTVTSLSDDNLITNGDFSQGEANFTSDYIPATGGGVGPLSNEGQYMVATNAGDTHNQFANCNDHTTGNGNMLVVNASAELDNIWCQTVDVIADTDYFFSAWITSVVSQNPAMLQLSIDGLAIENAFNASSTTCNWQQYGVDWTPDVSASVEVCITNINFTAAGNDFAIDDISLQPYCTTVSETFIHVTELNSDLEVPAQLCASPVDVDPNVFLANEASTGGNWQLDGQPITVFNPAMLNAGNHLLTYTVNTSNCSSNSSAQFSLVQPESAGQADFFRTCHDFQQAYSVNLQDVISMEALGGSWEIWDGPTGAVIDANSGMFTTNVPGNFTALYQTVDNGVCPPDSTFQNFEINANPIVDLNSSAIIPCDIGEVEIGGPNTSIGNNFLYEWYLNGTDLISQYNRTLVVDEAGDYLFRVTDENTGCSSEATTTITDAAEGFSFEVSATPPPCDDPMGGNIAIDNVMGGTSPYLYSLNNGGFGADPLFTNLADGTYTLRVQDATGCEVENMATIVAPALPEVFIQSSVNDIATLGETVNLTLVTSPPINELDTIFWTPALPDSLRLAPDKWSFPASETTLFQATIRDAQGCEVSAEYLLTVRPNGALYIPNAISPNEDGSNDRFAFYDDGAVRNINYVRIFDRWGGLVYEAKDLLPNTTDRGWDGRKQGELMPAGVYIYSAEVLWNNGTVGLVQGEISLVY